MAFEVNKKYYHGTHQEFNKFRNPKRLPQDIGGYSSKQMGTYFTENRELAGKFGTRVVERELEVKKPLDISGVKDYDELTQKFGLRSKNKDKENELAIIKGTSHFDKFGVEGESSPYRAIESLNDKYGVVKKLKRKGYDSIIFNDEEEGAKGKTVIVFSPKSIKE